MIDLLRDIADFILPRFCVICGERLTAQERCLCVNCLRQLPYTYAHMHKGNEIERLFWYHIPIERAASYCFYEGEGLRNAIHHFKYHSRPDIGLFLSEAMAREYAEHGFFEGVDVIVPVPLHWKKRVRRGYNQCDYIAKGIGRITHIPVEVHALRRTVNNKSQASLHHSERKENAESIFQVVRPERLQGKHVLLVDDVITTGSTILSCAREVAKVPDTRLSVLSLAYAGMKFMLSVSPQGGKALW